jgi:hypothetical protein
LGWLYWALALAIILFALWLPKTWWAKLTLAAVVCAGVVYPLFVRPVQQHVDERQQAQAAYAQKLAAATALFKERCKTAGETIKRTVQNVDGVVWMKWRSFDVSDVYDQFKLFDPFGRDCWAEGCIEQLLTLPEQNGRFEREVKQRKGRFRWVESVDPSNGLKYRYVGVMKLPSNWTAEDVAKHRRDTGQEVGESSYRFFAEETPIDRFTARFGITWDDISTREDREHWIAGGSLKVIDLKTNEVIAERVGYMMDRGLGDRTGGRGPWGFAMETACPAQLDESGRRTNVGFTNRFIAQVLKAKQGD